MVARSQRRPALRTLTEVFAPGSPPLPEGLRTLVVSPARFIEPGMTVRATFSFRNLGGGPAKGIRIRFALPEGLTYLVDSARIDNAAIDTSSGIGSLVQSGGAEIGEIEAGAERRVSVAYIVAPTMENGTAIELQAAITSIDLPLVGSNIVRLIVRSKPQLAGEKTTLTFTGPRETLPGSECSVTARIHNAGQSSANDVVIALPVPVGTTFVEDSAQAGGKAIADRKRRDPFGYQSPLPVARKLGPGETLSVGYRVRVDPGAADGSVIEAAGSVASREVSEFSLTPVSIAVAAHPSLGGEGTGFDAIQIGGTALAETVTPGQPVVLRIRAHNIGTGPAHALELSIELPAGLESVPSSMRRDGQPSLARGEGSAWTFAIGDLQPGASVNIEMIAIVAAPAASGRTLPIGAKVRWNGGTRSFDRILTVASSPRFSAARNRIVREGPPVVVPGDPVAFVLTVVNDGTASANDTSLRMHIDDGFDDVELSEGGDVRRLRGDEIALGAVEPHVPRTLRVSGRVRSPLADGTEIGVRATLAAAGCAPLDVREERVTVRARARFNVKTSTLARIGDEALRPDRDVAVRVAVTNEGDDVARDIGVMLRFSPELRLESAEGALRNAQTVIFGEVGAGQSREATVRLRLLPFVAKNTPLTVDGLLGGGSIMPVSLETLALSSEAEPRLNDGATLVTTPRDGIDAGGEVGFTLVLRNSGDGAAERVTIRGRQPASTAYVPASTSVNGVPLLDRNGTSLLWSDDGLVLSEVAPGAEMIVRWLSIVNTPLPPETVLGAALEVAYDGVPAFAVDSNPLAVRSAPAFAVPQMTLPFSISGAAAAQAGGGLLDRGAFELPMRRVVALPVAEETPALAASHNGAVHEEIAPPVDQSRVPFALDWDATTFGEFPDYVEHRTFNGLITHLFVLRALFPQRTGGAAGLLDAQSAALRELFDRLFIKLRLPGTKIAVRDVESERSRDTTVAFLEGVARTPVESLPARVPEMMRIHGAVEKLQCERLATQIEAAPQGGAMQWYALAHFVGDTLEGDGTPSVSIARYREELLATLSAFTARPLSTFVTALSSERSAELDQALAAFVSDVRARAGAVR